MERMAGFLGVDIVLPSMWGSLEKGAFCLTSPFSLPVAEIGRRKLTERDTANALYSHIALEGAHVTASDRYHKVF